MSKVETKSWYKSKTVIGIAISAIGKGVAMYYNLQIQDVELEAATEAVTALVNADTISAAIALSASFIGDIVAFYGRVKATAKVTK